VEKSLIPRKRNPNQIKLKKKSQTSAIAKAHRETSRGYASLIEGDWVKAERQLMTNIDKNPTPMLNYLAAANAAQQRDDYEGRDGYIKKALAASPRERLAIGLTKARLQYQAGQLEDSTTTLKKIQAFAPRNPRVLRLVTEVGQASGDWETVLAALPAARRSKALSADELDELEVKANKEVLALPAATADTDEGQEVDRRFDSLSRAKRKDPRVNHDKAELVVRNMLKKNWDSELVYLYGLANSSKPDQALKTAETWTKNHQDDPDLLLTLGRLAKQNKIWGKARSYLESCIAAGGRDEAHRELGQLLEQLGEDKDAIKAYRRGMDRFVASDSNSSLLPEPGENAAPAAAATETVTVEPDQIITAGRDAASRKS